MRLRRQLLLYGLGTTAVLSLLSVVALVLLQTITLPAVMDSLERKTAMSTRSLAAMDIALATEEMDGIKRLVDELAKDEDLRFVYVCNTKYESLFTYGTRPTKDSHFPQGTVLRDNGLALGAQKVVFEGIPLGHIEVAYSSSAVRTLRTWIRMVALVTLLLVLASVLVSFKFANAIVRPIDSMVAFTKSVGKGNLNDRVPLGGGATEMQVLAQHLNAMTESIQQRDVALAQQQTKLESNLLTIHETREQLLSSTRLAAVGEMAGRTAHEVLNPVSSMHGRLTRLTETRVDESREDREIILEIIASWKESYLQGGFEGLLEGLEESCLDNANKPLFEEDVENFEVFLAHLDEQNTSLQTDLAFLLKEIDRITHIVDGMRSMTRSSGTPQMHEINSILAESVDILQDGFKKRNILADIQGSDGLLVYVDRYELIQVITNLLRNSMLAIEEDRGRAGGRVSLHAEDHGATAMILVRDNGPGIAEEHKPFLFEPNFTTRSSSDGTGLGLAIARRLVRAIEGDLTLADSEVGVGTTFRIELPQATRAVPLTENHHASA